jgi:metallo-beta-lactamase class B
MPRLSVLKAALAVVAVSASAYAAEPAASAPDSPAVLEHIEKARKLAGADLQAPLFLCRADAGMIVRNAIENDSGKWMEPTKVFDNIFWVGNRFVGVFIVKTSEGLILFDSSSSLDEAQNHLVPGIVKLGLDPKTIRYVFVTHGHYDHFGGAPYLQKTFGAKIGLSGPDWDLIEKGPANAPGTAGREAPKRDVTVADGQVFTLGDTKIAFHVTPGHTPGALSAIIVGKEKGREYPLSLLGSVAFPPNLDPTPANGGLLLYDKAVQSFGQASRKAGAVGILNTHAFADGGLARLETAASSNADAPNPFLIGADTVNRYYGLFSECLKAAIARPHSAADIGKPSVPPRP